VQRAERLRRSSWFRSVAVIRRYWPYETVTVSPVESVIWGNFASAVDRAK